MSSSGMSSGGIEDEWLWGWDPTPGIVSSTLSFIFLSIIGAEYSVLLAFIVGWQLLARLVSYVSLERHLPAQALDLAGRGIGAQHGYGNRTRFRLSPQAHQHLVARQVGQVRGGHGGGAGAQPVRRRRDSPEVCRTS